MAILINMCYHKLMNSFNHMKKIFYLPAIICTACLMLLSCVSAGMGSEPEYLIKAKRDNGFVSAYKAHFALDGENIYKISERKYDDLTLGEDSKYKVIQVDSISFDVSATGDDLSKWNVSLPYDYKNQANPYTRESLINDLTQMGVTYRGSLYVLVTRFDDYKIVQVTNLDGNSVIDESYALFKNGSRLPLSKNIDLSSIWQVRRRK